MNQFTLFNRKKMGIFAVFCLLSVQVFAQKNANSGWHIVAQNPDPKNYFGVTVANGMIGLVSSPEPLKVKETVLNGVFDTYSRGRVSNILKGFNFANFELEVAGRRLGRKDISNFSQTLDMKKAILETTFDYQNVLSIKSEMMALRQLPYSSLITISITAKTDCEVHVLNQMEAPDILRDVHNYYNEIAHRPHVKIPLMTSVGKSPTGKHTIAATCTYLFDGKNATVPEMHHEEWDHNMHYTRIVKKMKQGETYKFAVVGTEITSATTPDPHNEAERLAIFACLEGTEKLIQYHTNAWAELWKSDIEISGDLQAQRDVHSMLYHLYSFVRAGSGYSMSPMGLSGLGYNGHVFWDTELWMYPPLLMLQPEIAKSILEYRFQRLELAKKNAFSHGYQGAMFPWESDEEGMEATPVWALTGPFQHHITGCIGFAFWQYYLVTGDKKWLETRGYPLLKEVADFWCSRVERNGAGHYDIKNVIGADEYAENIDNNAFTNGVAIASLRAAIKAAQVLGIAPNADWEVVAANIPLPKMPNGATAEYDGYKGIEIKQADVNLLAYPLGVITDVAQVKKDLNYYEPLYDSKNGPAMGPSVLSILHSRLGNDDKALEWFKKSYKANEVPPFGVISETAGGTNPYFATGAGGALQAVINGFGALDITPQGIVQLRTPKLPVGWQSLKITGVGINEATFEVKNK